MRKLCELFARSHTLSLCEIWTTCRISDIRVQQLTRNKHCAQCEICKLKWLFVARLALHKKLGYQASLASPSFRLIATLDDARLRFESALFRFCFCYQFYLVTASGNWNSLEFIKSICAVRIYSCHSPPPSPTHTHSLSLSQLCLTSASLLKIRATFDMFNNNLKYFLIAWTFRDVNEFSR